MTTFDTCYASLITSEGGWSNNPRDHGGMTNLGVTKRAWEAWVGHPVTETDMRALTAEQVAPFYRALYWNPVHGDNLPPSLALCLFHSSVNDGARRTAMLLQSVVGAAPDGAIGPATLHAVMAWIGIHGERKMVTAFQDALRTFYRGLSTFEVFGKGWLNRANDIEQQAMELAK